MGRRDEAQRNPGTTLRNPFGPEGRGVKLAPAAQAHRCLLYDGAVPISRGRGEMADAADLNKHECANRETGGVELLKVGET